MVYEHQLHQLDHHQFTQMGMMGALMDLAFGMDHPCIVLYYMVDGVCHEMQNTIHQFTQMGTMGALMDLAFGMDHLCKILSIIRK
jgi:hypothetical protein